ncbi:hypothetical protein ACQJBY_012982 [Aegilops geniculata]
MHICFMTSVLLSSLTLSGYCFGPFNSFLFSLLEPDCRSAYSYICVLLFSDASLHRPCRWPLGANQEVYAMNQTTEGAYNN